MRISQISSLGRREAARAAMLLSLSLPVLGSAPALAGSITVKGSDTMVILAQRWAEEYMKKNPSVKIQVTGGGSGTGIAALMNGTTDFADASRKIKSDEKMSVEGGKKGKVVEI